MMELKLELGKQDLLSDALVKAYDRFNSRNCWKEKQKNYRYENFREAINKRLNQWVKSGIQPGDILAIYYQNDWSSIVNLHACLLAGLTYVPVNPDFPEARKKYMEEKSGATHRINSNKLKRIRATDSSPAPKKSIAYILFTSGSTGIPKAVPISRENLWAFLTSFEKFDPQDESPEKVLQAYEWTFDASVKTLIKPFLHGHEVVPVPKGGHLFLNMIRSIRDFEVNVIYTVPSFAILSRNILLRHQFTSVRKIYFGGEAMPANLLPVIRQAFPNAQFFNIYGPTECTVNATGYKIPERDAEVKSNMGFVSIGKTLDAFKYRLKENGTEHGSTGNGPYAYGELMLKGPQVFDGYPGEKPDTENPYYATGDIVAKDLDGDLYFLKRKDAQVQIQGFRVEPGEVEYLIRDVIGDFIFKVIPIQMPGQTSQLVCCYEDRGREIGPSLQREIKDQLPLHMHPGRYLGIKQWPLNASGKTDIVALSAMATPVTRSESCIRSLIELYDHLADSGLCARQVVSENIIAYSNKGQWPETATIYGANQNEMVRISEISKQELKSPGLLIGAEAWKSLRPALSEKGYQAADILVGMEIFLNSSDYTPSNFSENRNLRFEVAQELELQDLDLIKMSFAHLKLPDFNWWDSLFHENIISGSQWQFHRILNRQNKLAAGIMVNIHGKNAIIYFLAVHPDYRGKGLSLELLKEGMNYLATHGTERVESHANKISLKLHLKANFHIMDKLVILKKLKK